MGGGGWRGQLPPDQRPGPPAATTFKKAFGGQFFEMQVTQSLNDGNTDFRWKQAAVFTNKAQGLWKTTKKVSAEDVRHMKSRVEMFYFTHQLLKTEFQYSI